MNPTIEELKEQIVDHIDPDEFLEVLDIGIEELVEAFSDKIEENYEPLLEVLPDNGYGED